ncbi:MAG TPA: methyltransferase domain-containing protein [Kofleriaceae bacterium]|nr:methyltransferase domain-containing protein [Kofleriaceae bacterium]
METALRQPDIADVFERALVPAIFAPYARDLIERIRPIGPADRILDLGCGTGIVARLLRERLGGAAAITGIDLSAPMIGKARELAPELDWQVGDAAALPFRDRAFDIVVCQQMLQFAPDRDAVLREVRRVLSPGGRFVVSVWGARREQPLHDAIAAVAERHLGPSRDRRFSLAGAELRERLIAAGFADLRLVRVTLTEHHRELPIRPSLGALGFALDDVSPSQYAAIAADIDAALAQYRTADGFAAPSSTTVVVARLPEELP